LINNWISIYKSQWSILQYKRSILVLQFCIQTPKFFLNIKFHVPLSYKLIKTFCIYIYIYLICTNFNIILILSLKMLLFCLTTINWDVTFKEILKPAVLPIKSCNFCNKYFFLFHWFKNSFPGLKYTHWYVSGKWSLCRERSKISKLIYFLWFLSVKWRLSCQVMTTFAWYESFATCRGSLGSTDVLRLRRKNN